MAYKQNSPNKLFGRGRRRKERRRRHQEEMTEAKNPGQTVVAGDPSAQTAFKMKSPLHQTTSKGKGVLDDKVVEIFETITEGKDWTDQEVWDENKDGVQDTYDSFQDYKDAADKYRKDKKDKGEEFIPDKKEGETVITSKDIPTEGTPGTPGKDPDQLYNPTPWEARWANRTQNIAIRDERRKARKRYRALSKLERKGVDLTEAEKLEKEAMLRKKRGDTDVGKSFFKPVDTDGDGITDTYRSTDAEIASSGSGTVAPQGTYSADRAQKYDRTTTGDIKTEKVDATSGTSGESFTTFDENNPDHVKALESGEYTNVDGKLQLVQKDKENSGAKMRGPLKATISGLKKRMIKNANTWRK